MLFSRLILSLITVFIITTVTSCSENPPAPSFPTTLKSYSPVSTSATLNADFETNSEGQTESITWKRETPTITEGADVFSYDASGKLTEMTRSITGLHDERIVYTYYDGKIGYSEHYEW